MIGALLGAALAVLLWPGRRVGSRARRARLARPSEEPAPAVASSLRIPPPVVAAAVAVAGGAVLSTPLVAGLAGVSAAAGARVRQARRAARRAESELAALAEALTVLVAELRSGRPLEAATEAAAASCADVDCGRALARSVRAPESPGGAVGGELAGALQRVGAAVQLSVRTGCSLAAVLSAVEDDLRARRRARADLHTATAGPRASALLLAGLPLLGLAMGSGVGADPWRVLTATGTGQVLLVLGVALELAGLAWSARLVGRAVG